MGSKRRVVITGMGVVCPLGGTHQSLWEALSEGRSGIGPLESIPTEHLPTSFGAEVQEFTGHISQFGPLEKDQKKNLRKGLRIMCREIQMGIAAAQMAMDDAGLLPENFDPERTGVVYGSDYMMTLPDEFIDGVVHCQDDDGQFEFSRWPKEGMTRLAPLWLLKYLPNMPACYIAIYNDIRGPNNSITIREASANLAMGEALHTIARGSADILITGGTGTRVHPMRTVHVALQEQLATDADDPTTMSRPFDMNRTGMVLGEGAGSLVFEELESAKARGANILAEVVGAGSSTVADQSGVARCDTALENVMRQALGEADMTPDQVGHIHAHGLGTRQCDVDEARAINAVFNGSAQDVPVTAAKSYFGNLAPGSGSVELIASVMAMEHGKLFPVCNYETPDPECPLSIVTSDDTDPGQSVLSANVSPQGQAGAILVRRFDG